MDVTEWSNRDLFAIFALLRMYVMDLSESFYFLHLLLADAQM